MVQEEPYWQPLSALPMIAQLIRETLNSTDEQYQTLREAEEKPYVLDDALIDRVIRLYTVQAEDVVLFEEQLTRWKKETLTPGQEQVIDQLQESLQQLRELEAKILSLAERLKEGTIDRILRKSDVELALDILSGKRKL
jgi:hypothetical protein